MKDVGKFFSEVRLELSRVLWPSYDEWMGATAVVVFLTTVLSLYLGLVDKGFDFGMKYLIEWWVS
ncbi:MAG: Preprotein translocase, SecE subunit [candidate division TM6 bacterium GW2011_GWF2_30_66]|nr:MAG: Preprotein translocase, SecE subunit [candidate division TM6 bacterium GW2011_GWF2_30_66]